jgi:CRP-like cAMP-binding protein
MYELAMPWITPQLCSKLKTFIYTNGKTICGHKGEIIVREDEYLDRFILVKSGALSNSIVRHNLSKSFLTCGLRTPGQVSGYTTYIVEDPAPVRIVSLVKSELYYVTFRQMDSFLAKDLALKTALLHHCGKCLRSEIDTMLAMITLPAEEKIWILLASILTAYDVELTGEWVAMPFKISREALSGLLYVTLLTIDRLFPSLIKQGAARRDGSTYYFKKPFVLQGLEWIEKRYNLEKNAE